MRNHYIPRHYLRGFSPDFGAKVWTYDRKETRKFCSNVVNIGQENGLYSDELEATLSEDVEGPANKALNKIRDKQDLTPEEKVSFSLYLITLWKRVPAGKNRVHKLVPELLSNICSNVRSEMDRIISQEPEHEEICIKRKKEVADILARSGGEPPDTIWHDVVRPGFLPDVEAQIPKMNWMFFVSQQPASFITCDNPVFFFEKLGLGNSDSELSMPISGDVVLWATNRKILDLRYYAAEQSKVKEFNRRTVRNSTRYVYAGIDHDWIKNFVFKGSWQLNRVK